MHCPTPRKMMLPVGGEIKSGYKRRLTQEQNPDYTSMSLSRQWLTVLLYVCYMLLGRNVVMP